VNPFDAIVVGAGLAGSAVAFELAREKLRVLLLDREDPSQEASWAAAGMLSPAPDSPEALPLVPLARASLALYPGFISRVEEASGLVSGHRQDGALEIFSSADARAVTQSMHEERLRLGLSSQCVSGDDARAIEPALNPAIEAALWMPEEASVEPRLLLRATFAAARNSGAQARSGAEVTSLCMQNGRVTGVRLAGEEIQAGHVVIAAGAYSGRIEGLARYAPTSPVRGQMISLRAGAAAPRRVLRSEAGYVVPRGKGNLVAGSTLEEAGYRKEVTPEGLGKILAAAVGLAPSLREAEVADFWSGLRPDTPDHLPILGPCDVENLFFATGHYRNGILLAPATAEMLCDWITGRTQALPTSQFSPMRFASSPRRKPR
jgi:glycine oxidase